MADDVSLRLAKLQAALIELDNNMASGILRLEDADTGTVQNRTYTSDGRRAAKVEAADDASPDDPPQPEPAGGQQ